MNIEEKNDNLDQPVEPIAEEIVNAETEATDVEAVAETVAEPVAEVVAEPMAETVAEAVVETVDVIK